MAILSKVTVNQNKLAAAVTVKNVSGGLQQTNKVNPVSLIASAGAAGGGRTAWAFAALRGRG